MTGLIKRCTIRVINNETMTDKINVGEATAFSIGEVGFEDETLDDIGAREGTLYILMKDTPANVELSKKIFLN